MKAGSVEVTFKPDRSAIMQGSQDAGVRVLVSARPLSAHPTAAPPVTAVVLLDCSGTVRRLRVDDDQAKHWVDVARERSEVRVADSDGRTVYMLRGQTLEEVRAVTSSAFSLATAALGKVVAGLRDNDVCSLVGFATTARVLYDGRPRLRGSSLQDALSAMQKDPASTGLGDGTRMQDGVRLAAELLRSDPSTRRVRRLVIISDGIVEDPAESLRELDQLRNQGIAVTTVGVGQEFDEEFLIRIADWTGGSYHYAPKPEDIDARLAEDFGTFHAVAGRNLRVAARGHAGAVVNSVSQLTPQMRMFEEIRLKDDWFEVEVGDIAGREGLSLLAEFSVPWLTVGKYAVGELQLHWQDPESGQTHTSQFMANIECLPQDATPQEADPEVQDLYMRLQVYRGERAAQWAHEGGRAGLSTVRLREASQILNRLGESELADRFERQAADVEEQQVDSDRTKIVKDWVRRLGQRGKDHPA